VPPHLLPGVTGRAKKGNGNRLRLMLLGAGVLVSGTLLAGALFVLSTVAGVGGTVAAYREVNAELPNASSVAATTFQSSRIYDRDGKLLQEVDDPDRGWRTFVPFDQISPYLIDATVAAEDATYWTHYGVEPLAIVRGVLINTSGAGSSGGSTITQQLTRAIFPDKISSNDQSYTRKAREALVAVELERQFSKRDIMTMYLNEIFYGNRSYGIEAASQTFFNKHASELTLAEASLLAGLPQQPTSYNPAVNLDAAKQRQEYVLAQMVKLGYITRAEAKAAFDETLDIRQDRSNRIFDNPHFTNYVRGYVQEVLGEDALFRGGLQITTSIDSALQDDAERIVQAQVANLRDFKASNGSMVAMVPYTGEIIAMVGSANFDDPIINGEVNIAVSPQQPGSSIKPLAYAAAFEQGGWTPGTVVLDSRFRREVDPPEVDPVTGEPVNFYEPQNYTGNFYGAVTVRTALANSLNIPAVKAVEYVGVPSMIDLARRMGMVDSFTRDPSEYGVGIALGGGEVQLLELTNAYATFANNGRYVPANPILKITDSLGNVLYELDREEALEQGQQGLQAEYAYQITSVLTDNAARRMLFGPDNLFETTAETLGRPTAAKSGTTNDVRDVWTMGYTTDLAVGVWVGNTDNTQMVAMDGIEGAGPIWSEAMTLIHENPEYAELLNGPDGRPLDELFPRPAGIYEGELCSATGHKPVGSSPARKEVLARGGGPGLRCDQLNAYERNELDAALADIRENPRKYVGGAIDSIRRYEAAANGNVGGGRPAADVGMADSDRVVDPAQTEPGTGEATQPAGGPPTPPADGETVPAPPGGALPPGQEDAPAGTEPTIAPQGGG
jgi:membrane peptidoglycan carboxypeptidase